MSIENRPPNNLVAHVKSKCKAHRETEFFRQNSVSVAPFLNMDQPSLNRGLSQIKGLHGFKNLIGSDAYCGGVSATLQ